MEGKYGAKLEDFQSEAIRIVNAAAQNGWPIRIIGCLAFRIKCPDHVELHKAMGREVTDIDYVAYYKNQRGIINMFRDDLGYNWIPPGFARASTLRDLFVNPKTGFKIDVFYDHLDFCHTIEFKGPKRLEVDQPTIPLAELFLEKMQIVEINAKDFYDLIITFLTYDVSETHDDSIVNGHYIGKLMSEDWGFYYTVTENIKKFLAFVPKVNQLSDEQKKLVLARMNKLYKIIEDTPKSKNWHRRAKVGTKKRWFKVVHIMESDRI